MVQVLSNHIGGSSELLVLAKIKPGFVPIRTPLSYASRLRRHLMLVDALRRTGLEASLSDSYVGPIDTLQTLQFIQWTLIDNDTRMLLSVNFDRPFEPYIRKIVDVSGALLDSIFCHCEGFDGFSSDQGFHKFMEFIERNQTRVDLFAAAAPDFSVDDGDYFTQADAVLRKETQPDIDVWMTEHVLKRPIEKLLEAAEEKPDQLLDQSFNVLRAMFGGVPFFPAAASAGSTSDSVIYYNLVKTLLPIFWQVLIKRSPELSDAQKTELLANLDTSKPQEAFAAIVNAQNSAKDPLLAHLIKTHQIPMGWFGRGPQGQTADIKPLPTVPGKVQAGLLDKPAKATHSCIAMFRVDDPAAGRAFLAHMDGLLWPAKPGANTYALSITKEGLSHIGMHRDKLAEFPRSFLEGMEKRAGLLGDTDVNHPSNWVWPTGNWPAGSPERAIAPSSIDIIVQVTGAYDDLANAHVFDEKHPLYASVAELDAASGAGVRLLAVQPMQRRYNDAAPARVVNHLGFVDGVGQPRIGTGPEYHAEPDNPEDPPVPEEGQIGDILVGHQSKLNAPANFERPPLPLLDGTFQVIRKIRLNVDQFEEIAAAAEGCGADATEIKAKMMGRSADGTPLSSSAKDFHNFNYMDDPKGRETPLQSHVRRCNPRKFDTPRILRRGFSYGPYRDWDGATNEDDRGMMFIAYNANLAQQFEVIQRWVSGGNSTGISSAHGDPLLAPRKPGGEQIFRYTRSDDKGDVTSVRVPLNNLPVGILQWGLYAFTPSQDGLRTLADAEIEKAPETAAAPDLSNLPQSSEDWQTVLEDTGEMRIFDRLKAWKWVQSEGGAKQTPYGVVVTGADAVRHVLVNKDKKLSTAPYLGRMKPSLGAQYLGFDLTNKQVAAGQDHAKESSAVWDYLNTELDPAHVFKTAFGAADAHIAALSLERRPTENGALDGEILGRQLSLVSLINDVAGALCGDLFGLRGADMVFGSPEFLHPGKAHCPGDFLSSAAYIFAPDPPDFMGPVGQKAGQEILTAFRNLVSEDAPEGTLFAALKRLSKEDPYWTDEKVALNLGGVTMGLIAPVMGSFLSIMFDWIRTGTLWRLQQQLQEAAPQSPQEMQQFAMSRVLPAAMRSMARRVVPDLIQRQATADTEIAGCPVKKDQLIIGSLGGAIFEHPEQAEFFLFGGKYDADKSSGTVSEHACPGKAVGLTSLAGVLTRILTQPQIEPLSPVSIWMK